MIHIFPYTNVLKPWFHILTINIPSFDQSLKLVRRLICLFIDRLYTFRYGNYFFLIPFIHSLVMNRFLLILSLIHCVIHPFTAYIRRFSHFLIHLFIDLIHLWSRWSANELINWSSFMITSFIHSLFYFFIKKSIHSVVVS